MAGPHTEGIMSRARIEMNSGPSSVPPIRSCDHPGCGSGGDFRAPRSRDALDQFYWFCLDHVRAYNAAWNYYAGMNQAEIEADIRNDTVWQRPTWPLGSRLGARYGGRFRDYGLFDEENEPSADSGWAAAKRPLSQQELALAIFDLEPPFTMGGLKTRYKQLVKLYHPDVHGGDKAAEERLKVINQAYSTLKACYFP